MDKRIDIETEIVIIIVEKICNDEHDDKSNVFIKTSFPC